MRVRAHQAEPREQSATCSLRIQVAFLPSRLFRRLLQGSSSSGFGDMFDTLTFSERSTKRTSTTFGTATFRTPACSPKCVHPANRATPDVSLILTYRARRF